MPRHRRRIVVCSLLASLVTLAGVVLARRAGLLQVAMREHIYQRALAPSSHILDRQGRVLYRIVDPHAGFHQPLALEDMPLDLCQAIIATEDAGFYHNAGIDPKGILRAAWLNLRAGEIVSGGSTITQQLARNLLMNPDERWSRTWQRKARESLLAVYLTAALSKDEILELYLNETYFGHMAYGVGAAARAYFCKPAAQLDLAECAMLAGLPQSPVAYDPLTDLEAAKQRQRTVLDLMVEAGAIDQPQADRAYEEPLHFASSPFEIEAPHFCMLVRQQLGETLGESVIRQGGLRIHTTLDLALQQMAEQAVAWHLAQLNRQRPDEPGHEVHNAALVVMEPASGAVRAMVGSPDYFEARIDGAVNAALSLRQPGSAIKPLTYAAALENGLTLGTVIADVQTSFTTQEDRPYQPVNYDYRFHGPVTLRRALACSYNVATVRLYEQLGPATLPDMAGRLGVTTLNRSPHHSLALTLGSGEVQLLQLVAAYGALANGGMRVEPYFVERIEDATGQVLYQAAPNNRERVLDRRIAYLITNVLADDLARAPAFGEGSVLELPFDAAVKTGTTTDWRDNWTVGYSSRLVVGVWTGNADAQPMLRVSGVSGAAPIWHAVMVGAHPEPPRPFERPDGLIERTICPESGLLAGPACPHRKEELFLAKHVPTTRCTMHRFVTVDVRTGAPAPPDLPDELAAQRRVTIWPDGLLAWAEEQGLDTSGNVASHDYWPAQSAERATAQFPADAAGINGLSFVRPAANSRYAISGKLPPLMQRIEVRVAIAPSMALKRVHLVIDGRRLHTWDGPPYQTLWPLAPGEHILRLEADTGDGRCLSGPAVAIHVALES